MESGCVGVEKEYGGGQEEWPKHVTRRKSTQTGWLVFQKYGLECTNNHGLRSPGHSDARAYIIFWIKAHWGGVHSLSNVLPMHEFCKGLNLFTFKQSYTNKTSKTPKVTEQMTLPKANPSAQRYMVSGNLSLMSPERSSLVQCGDHSFTLSCLVASESQNRLWCHHGWWPCLDNSQENAAVAA